MRPGSLSRCYRPEPSSWLSVTGESHENAPYLARHSLFVLPSYVPSLSLPAERLIVLCWRGGLIPPPFFFFFFKRLNYSFFFVHCMRKGGKPMSNSSKDGLWRLFAAMLLHSCSFRATGWVGSSIVAVVWGDTGVKFDHRETYVCWKTADEREGPV